MEIGRKWRFSCLLLGLYLLVTTLQVVQGETEGDGPSESECRPYIEKALKELETTAEPGAVPIESGETGDGGGGGGGGGRSDETPDESRTTADDSVHAIDGDDDDTDKTSIESADALQEATETHEPENEIVASNEAEEAAKVAGSQEEHVEENESIEEVPESSQEANASFEEAMQGDQPQVDEAESEDGDEAKVDNSKEVEDEVEADTGGETEAEANAEADTEAETDAEAEADPETEVEALEDAQVVEEELIEDDAPTDEVAEDEAQTGEVQADEEQADEAQADEAQADEAQADEAQADEAQADEAQADEARADEAEADETEADEAQVDEVQAGEAQTDEAQADEAQADEAQADEAQVDEAQVDEAQADEAHEVQAEEVESDNAVSGEAPADEVAQDEASSEVKVEEPETEEGKSAEATGETEAQTNEEAVLGEKLIEEAGAEEVPADAAQIQETEVDEAPAVEEAVVPDMAVETEATPETASAEASTEASSEVPEEDLILDIEIPDNLRPREHVDQLLKLDEGNTATEAVSTRVADVTLKELKRLYEHAIKPLEILYKYRDLSNRHFGDSEIFSKPLVLFMGPWSGGKSSIINYLVDNEYNTTSLRTGAEPSPAYFNILMHGESAEVLDGTQLAADFTFAGLQKFGQGLEERLRGLKLPSKLLEKINIVEIPGILEVRKQVSRVFPFNDACQWFIDRADIIFLVYDPSKLDVGPETEAILDQLKGREYQTRIVLNKADQVKPEELMRVQGALIWNISPLMSSAQPPVMYTTSLWSRPYESWAPVRLLQAQERAFLRDLRSAVDKRIENKISSARRFAVRVRNHAKMVDCYLTTYYNHKSVFGNRKQVADKIIEHPQDYHIYEGLSTLTNISRYDLPDPDVYRDFFRLNPLYDFQQLSATCTYFRGCPINRLDVAIAYDLPELVGKHKKLVEAALAEVAKTES